MKPTRYKIIKFYSDHRSPKRVKIALSEREAKEWCSHPNTRGTLRNGIKWFDGWTKI